MQSFRYHLCPDQDVDFARAKIAQGLAIRFLAGHGVGVHPAHVRFWEKLGNGGLYLFGAKAGIDQRVFAACRTFFWNRGGMPAEMAAQASHVPVKCERDAAIRAMARFTTTAAKQ